MVVKVWIDDEEGIWRSLRLLSDGDYRASDWLPISTISRLRLPVINYFFSELKDCSDLGILLREGEEGGQ